MKIKHFSTIIFICLFVVTPCGPVYSCYFDYSDEDYRVFYFNPAVAETSKILEAFHYSKSFYFKRSSPYPENEEGEDPDMVRNCKEWQAQLGKAIDLGDIDTLMYQTESTFF